MQRFIAISLVAILAANTASAADNGALPPGKPAGVNQAQDLWNPETLAVIGGGLGLVVGFALLIKGGTSVPVPIAAGTGGNSVFGITNTNSTPSTK